LIAQAARPASMPIHDPCELRQLPDLGGFDELLQNGALALVDPGCARAYGRDHGVQPGDVGSVLTALQRP
jgi:hypothetical protein